MKCLAMVLVVLMLAACSGGDAPAPAGAVSRDNALSTQVEALAKAREANKVIHDTAEQQRRELDAIDTGE